MLPGTNHARAIARSGVDWICVDTEHGNINDSQMHEAVTAIAHAGVSPLVRIAANEPWMVKRKLPSTPTPSFQGLQAESNIPRRPRQRRTWRHSPAHLHRRRREKTRLLHQIPTRRNPRLRLTPTHPVFLKRTTNLLFAPRKHLAPYHRADRNRVGTSLL